MNSEGEQDDSEDRLEKVGDREKDELDCCPEGRQNRLYRINELACGPPQAVEHYGEYGARVGHWMVGGLGWEWWAC
jgi:hypothetical protein